MNCIDEAGMEKMLAELKKASPDLDILDTSEEYDGHDSKANRKPFQIY